MEKLFFVVLLIFVQQISSEDVIYKLSKEEYSRMPPRVYLDHFAHCMYQPGGVYCTARADVVSDVPSDLLDMMRAYSNHKVKHMNYTKLTYGLCLTKSCKRFFNGSDEEAHLKTAAEACLNRTLSEDYDLKTRVTELNCFFEKKQSYDLNWVDWLVALLVLGIVALNVVGTIYEVNRDQDKPGNLLTVFSLRKNWNQLRAPPPTDPVLVRLTPINGIRVITATLVILGHTPLPLLVGIENPTWIENAYDVSVYHILAQGHLITLSFFVISGLLLAYNVQIQADKGQQLTLKILPIAVFNRWLRLTPINLMALLLASTWMKNTSQGPLWQECIGQEVHDCRNYWFYNLFFLNNLIDFSQCILQTWYLACDMHLQIIGMLIIALTPSPKARWWTMGALALVGYLWSAYHIYTKDLEGTLVASPTIMTEYFITDPTFNWVYKRTYSNMPFFLIGMTFGFLIYDWHKKDVFSMDLTKYRYVYLTLFPVTASLVSSAGFLFCGDAPRASMALRLAFGPIVKTLFVVLVMIIILGAMFKVENIQRSVMEWGGWVPLSRLSYCVYAFHVAVIRYLGGTRTTLTHFSIGHLLQDYAGTVVITFLVALIFYLFVEAPFANLVRITITNRYKVASTAVKDASSAAQKVSAVNGTSKNGVAVNGASKNGVAVNGSAGHGTKVYDVNGAHVTSTSANGSTLNGVPVIGTAVNGTTVNGSAVNGSANGHIQAEQITTGVKDKDA